MNLINRFGYGRLLFGRGSRLRGATFLGFERHKQRSHGVRNCSSTDVDIQYRLQHTVLNWNYHRVVLQSDGEPVIKQKQFAQSLQYTVLKKFDNRCTIQHSHDALERANQNVIGITLELSTARDMEVNLRHVKTDVDTHMSRTPQQQLECQAGLVW